MGEIYSHAPGPPFRDISQQNSNQVQAVSVKRMVKSIERQTHQKGNDSHTECLKTTKKCRTGPTKRKKNNGIKLKWVTLEDMLAEPHHENDDIILGKTLVPLRPHGHRNVQGNLLILPPKHKFSVLPSSEENLQNGNNIVDITTPSAQGLQPLSSDLW